MHIELVDGKTLEHWDAPDLAAGLQDGSVVLIDVRTPQEYMFEHIEGALLLPMADMKPQFLPPVESRKLVIHCGSGVRSRKVAEMCFGAGIASIAHLYGGFAAWKAAGLPYRAVDPATGGPRLVSTTPA